MENFAIAIPSYRRSESQESLKLLKKLGIQKDRIFIFVQTDEDYKKYSHNYAEDCSIILRHATNVAQARNNILDYFISEYGKIDILMLDDDITKFGIFEEKLEEIENKEDFDRIFEKCFEIANKRNVPLFGVYPIYNAFYMDKSITTKTTVNTLLGFTKKNSHRFNETYDAKEDIELCGRILSRGKEVLRFDFLAIEAKHRTNEGGTKEIWKSDKHEKTVKRLCLAYPNIFAPKKNNPKEVRMKQVIGGKKIKL